LGFPQPQKKPFLHGNRAEGLHLCDIKTITNPLPLFPG
jgi:hypothetical protein